MTCKHQTLYLPERQHRFYSSNLTSDIFLVLFPLFVSRNCHPYSKVLDWFFSWWNGLVGYSDWYRISCFPLLFSEVWDFFFLFKPHCRRSTSSYGFGILRVSCTLEKITIVTYIKTLRRGVSYRVQRSGFKKTSITSTNNIGYMAEPIFMPAPKIDPGWCDFLVKNRIE